MLIVTGTTGNREQMRMQRSRDEIAEDVVAEFGLRMARARIFQTAWVVKNRHQACKLAFNRIFDDHDAKRPENCSGDARV